MAGGSGTAIGNAIIGSATIGSAIGVVSIGIAGGLLSIGDIFNLSPLLCIYLSPSTNCVITLPFLVETISVCELDNNP